jgi:YfiR/HmsC-like
MGAAASAQDVTEPALKAAFIYNFAKFTEWPADLSATAPLVICVLGDTAVGDELERGVKGRVLAGHGIAISLVAPAGPKSTCNVVYLSGMTSPQAALLVARLRDLPVLTISDVQGFIELGGIAQFRFEQGQLRFSVRLASVKRSRLQISSRLLALASIE